MKIPIFPGKYHQNGGFSMAMLVSGRVNNEINCLSAGAYLISLLDFEVQGTPVARRLDDLQQKRQRW